MGHSMKKALGAALVGGLVVCCLTGCSSAGGQVSAGGTTQDPTQSDELSCPGGGFSGISPDYATSTGQATPEEAIAEFTKYEKAVPADGYVVAVSVPYDEPGVHASVCPSLGGPRRRRAPRHERRRDDLASRQCPILPMS